MQKLIPPLTPNLEELKLRRRRHKSSRNLILKNEIPPTNPPTPKPSASSSKFRFFNKTSNICSKAVHSKEGHETFTPNFDTDKRFFVRPNVHLSHIESIRHNDQRDKENFLTKANKQSNSHQSFHMTSKWTVQSYKKRKQAIDENYKGVSLGSDVYLANSGMGQPGALNKFEQLKNQNLLKQGKRNNRSLDDEAGGLETIKNLKIRDSVPMTFPHEQESRFTTSKAREQNDGAEHHHDYKSQRIQSFQAYTSELKQQLIHQEIQLLERYQLIEKQHLQQLSGVEEGFRSLWSFLEEQKSKMESALESFFEQQKQNCQSVYDQIQSIKSSLYRYNKDIETCFDEIIELLDLEEFNSIMEQYEKKVDYWKGTLHEKDLALADGKGKEYDGCDSQAVYAAKKGRSQLSKLFRVITDQLEVDLEKTIKLVKQNCILAVKQDSLHQRTSSRR